MKWIKASERLPGAGKPVAMKWIDGETVWMGNILVELSELATTSYGNLLWRDESPSTPILGAEETLKVTYEHYKNVVKPDKKWARWEDCVDDGTVEMATAAMQTHSAQYRGALKDSLEMMEQTMAYRNANGITAGNVFLQSTIDKAKKLLNL